MQKAYIDELHALMKEDNRVFSLLSDSGTDYDMIVARSFPDRCLNFGIAEQNKVAAASGMAALGKIPFVYTSGAFLTYRAYEFIRDDVCFQDRNVKIVGMGSGLSWSQLGPSHHTTEDIAVLTSMPNLTIFSPATPFELRKCVRMAYNISGPVYIRMGMSGEPEIHTELYNSKDDKYAIDKSVLVLDSNEPDILIISTGSTVSEAVEAARRLQSADGLSVRLLHLPVLKPLDIKGILQAVRGVKKAVFTVEEHNIIGGIGVLISTVLAESGESFAPLGRIGLEDCFATGYGTYKQVLAANGLDCEGIYKTIIKERGAEK